MAQALNVPDWPEATVTVLVTGGRAIPMSTAVRVDDTTVRFGLGRRRGSLARLRADGRCGLVVIAEGVAVTLYGVAREVGEVEGVVALELTVDEVTDHLTPQTQIDSGVAWSWLDPEAAARDAAVRQGLRRSVCGEGHVPA